MYTLFVQKCSADATPFPLTALLNDFLRYTWADGVFLAPGHLSKTARTAGDVLDVFLHHTNVNLVGLGNIYGPNTVTLYENLLRTKGKLLQVVRSNRSDHRKMVFIYNCTQNTPVRLTRAELDDFLDSIHMVGVAIGSSNCSYTTYGSLNPGGPPANKGEADILMFDNPNYADHISRQIRQEDILDVRLPGAPRMVLSENITPVDSQVFLKDIFRQTLELTLL